MGRLFWKFFFFIWLAHLTTVAAVSLIFWIKHHESNNRSLAIDWSPSAGALVESAATTLQRAGPDALRALLATALYSGVYVVDVRGKELLGRLVSDDTLQRVRRILIENDHLPAVRDVKDGSGADYVLFMPRPAASDGRFAGRPGKAFHGPEYHLPIEPIVVGIFASLGFAALLAWYFSKPIRTLRMAFESLARGNLDMQLGTVMGRRRDELADLGHVFDAMVRRLRSVVEGQRRLLHDVSHELRSPLARLQAAIGLVRQQPEKLEATLERIEREGMRMDTLVGELLTLSKLEAGEIGAPSEEVNIGTLINDIVEDARFEAEARRIEVIMAGNCDAVITGDIELLHWGIENVVRNAVKYTPSGSKVSVTGHMDQKKGILTLSVLDQGPGVPEGELSAIFEPFFRGSGASSSEGHGLGLAIARRVVEAQGGTIRASNRPDGGLWVEIALPVRTVPSQR